MPGMKCLEPHGFQRKSAKLGIQSLRFIDKQYQRVTIASLDNRLEKAVQRMPTG